MQRGDPGIPYTPLPKMFEKVGTIRQGRLVKCRYVSMAFNGCRFRQAWIQRTVVRAETCWPVPIP